MTNPGSNLLNRAMRLLGKQTFTYIAYTARTKTSNGMLVSTYAAPVTMTGSIQPVPRNMYEQMGLDFQKNYVTIYAAKNMNDVARDVAGDQFIYMGRKFQAESKTDWFMQDGWDAIVCVEVPNA